MGILIINYQPNVLLMFINKIVLFQVCQTLKRTIREFFTLIFQNVVVTFLGVNMLKTRKYF